MNHARSFLIVAGLLGGVGATVFCLGQSDADRPADLHPSGVAVAGSRDADAEQAPEAAAGLERTAMATPAGIAALPPVEQGPLAVSGRVIDHLGNPIPGAKVRVQYRQSFAPFNAGGGNQGRRGNRGAAATAGTAPTGQDNQPLWTRNRADLTDAERARLDELRSRFRPQDAAAAVVTMADGHYRLEGKAYTQASLTIAVTHELYAPAVEQREWQSELGELHLADIALPNGAVVTGTVVDETGTLLAGAEVRWERNTDDPNAPPGGNNNNGRGGRGGRGNNGGRGGGGGFGRDPMQELLAPAITDGTGGFRIGPVPVEPFDLVATAPDHLDGRSRRLDPVDGQQLPAQRLVVVAATGISGIVRDTAGQPVANATVTGEVAREAMFAQFRAQRDAAIAAAPPANPNDPQAQRGRRGRGGAPGSTPGQGGQPGQGPGVDVFASMRAVMDAHDTARTNDKGEFRLAKLPRAQVKLTAEHRSHLTTTQEPVDATSTPNVVIVMPAALAIAGTVVDARTGVALDKFGIAANRIDPPADPNQNGQGFGGRNQGGRNGANNAQPPATAGTGNAGAGNPGNRGGRGNRGGNQDPEAAAAAAATAAAQAAAQAAAREAWLRQQLGTTGRMPGRVPPPTAHVDGKFVLDGLQAGEYSLDVDAPGYVRVAAEVVKLDPANNIEGLVVRVETGAVISGRVVRTDHSPVAGATVELLLADPPAGTGNVDAGNGNRGGRGGPGGFGGRRLARADTDAEGAFALAPQRQGTYRLRVQGSGLVDYTDPALVVPAPGSERAITVVMTEGGEITGVVKNLEPGVSARVSATSTTDRSQHGANVDAITGTYTITGLPAGGYLVALQERNADAEARRAMLGNALAQRDKQTPDVFVTAGATVHFDLVAGRDPLGNVLGTVFLNGAPATGMQVRLTRAGGQPVDTAPANPGRGGNGLQNVADQLLRTNVAADGTFALKSIPPGSWQLEVQRNGGQGRGGGGRGGRGGNNAAYKQPVEVVAFADAHVQIELRTSDVEFRIAMPPDASPDARLRVAIALASEAGSTDPQEWRRLDSMQQFFVRNGTTGVQSLPPGAYRYQVSGNGIIPIAGDVFLGGQGQVVDLVAQAAPVAPAPAAGQPGQPIQPGQPVQPGQPGQQGQPAGGANPDPAPADPNAPNRGGRQGGRRGAPQGTGQQGGTGQSGTGPGGGN
jgi:protocatechuate 3,4-dioxygenase beta subunit